MAEIQKIREAQRQIQREALARWNNRSAGRIQNKDDVARGGIGAADSPQRRARMSAREDLMNRARQLRQAGLLPNTLERRMGATLDYTPFAPTEAARVAGRPVARIVDDAGRGMVPEGIASGFLVTPCLLMTNHHVFPSKGETRGAGANFLYERTDRGVQQGFVFEVDADAFFLADETLDYAIVAVKERSIDGHTLAEFGITALIEATPKILIGEPVNIIQYPGGREKEYAISQNRLVDILDNFLQYQTDTLEGSSGSPAFSKNWELVALHHASIPAMRDGRVVATDGSFWNEDMGDDMVLWLANEGVRVSAIVKSLLAKRLDDPAQQRLLQQLLTTTTDPLDDVSKDTPTVPQKPNGIGINLGDQGMAGNIFNLSGSVTINVYGSTAADLAAVTAPAPPAVEKVIQFDPNYDGREGYDPLFLDPRHKKIAVPVPGIAKARLKEMVVDEKGKPRILKYHHYELAMNRSRRLQMWSAVNVDYDPKKKPEGGRGSFGTDKWIPDPRLTDAEQIENADFYKPAHQIDCGHMVRREDNCWGNTPQEIEYANSDTFHWTNCTPQHEAFNRSAPGAAKYGNLKGMWGDFENYIQSTLTGVDTRACVLAGPVLAADDPATDFGTGPVAYPLLFWKVIAVTTTSGDNTALQVYGFVLSQKPVVDRFGIERFGPGRFHNIQCTLKHIEDVAGVVFDKALHKADMMSGAGGKVSVTDAASIVGLVNKAASARRKGTRSPVSRKKARKTKKTKKKA